MKKYESIIVYGILILGIILIGCSIYFFSRTWIFKNKAVKTSGRIINVNSRLGGKNKVKEYAAIIAFKTADGNELTFQSERYTLSAPAIGEQLDVYYTIKPLHAVEDRFMTWWGVPLFLLGLGSIFIIFSLLTFYFKNK